MIVLKTISDFIASLSGHPFYKIAVFYFFAAVIPVSILAVADYHLHIEKRGLKQIFSSNGLNEKARRYFITYIETTAPADKRNMLRKQHVFNRNAYLNAFSISPSPPSARRLK